MTLYHQLLSVLAAIYLVRPLIFLLLCTLLKVLLSECCGDRGSGLDFRFGLENESLTHPRDSRANCLETVALRLPTGDGSSGDSIYGGKFNDEKPGLKLKHNKKGLLGMANSGKNSNTSQFYITFADNLPQLDGKHVIFGEVTEGLDLLTQIGDKRSGLQSLGKRMLHRAYLVPKAVLDPYRPYIRSDISDVPFNMTALSLDEFLELNVERIDS